MLELYQAEWCPHSRKIRQRLTELGVDFVARQVAADPERREEMWRATRTHEIPALVLDDRRVLMGEDEILGYLDEEFDEPADAAEHRAKALEKAGLPG